MPSNRGHQGHDRRRKQDGGDREIKERDKTKNQHRSECRDHQLGQVLSEICLQLLNPINQREHKFPGPLPTRITWTQIHDLVIEATAQLLLDKCCGFVRNHRPPVFKETPQ